MVEYTTDVAKLLSVRNRGDTFHAVESEIAQEKAGALGRAGVRLEEALETLKKAQDALGEIERRLGHRNGAPEDTGLLRDAYSRLIIDVDVLRQRAYLAHQCLIIQREAVGICDHSDVERCYRITERL